jgi:methyl-accepting chemotaxis protein
MIVLLAVINLILIALSYVGGSLLFSDARLTLIIATALTTATTFGFAGWMSNEVAGPLNRLSLLAKSLERSPGMSVPKTTGAVETDDLLHTISRVSRQLTNFVDLMDEVTAGNTRAALDPLVHSDRLSESFQKLVAKVTDSIDAKAELTQLQQAIDQISAELAGVYRGEAIRIRNEYETTRKITDALRYLLERQSELIRVLSPNCSELGTLATEQKNRIAAAVEKEAAHGRAVKRLTSGVSELIGAWDESLSALSASVAPAVSLAGELEQSSQKPDAAAKSHAAIKKQFDTAFVKLRDIGERSIAVAHSAKLVQDLARRSNMIALNTSIHAVEGSEAGLSTLAQEVGALSDRAEKASKAIAGVSESIVRDLNEANASLHWIAAEMGEIGAHDSDRQEAAARLSEMLALIGGLPARIEQISGEQRARWEKHAQLVQEIETLSEGLSTSLRSCEALASALNAPINAVRQLTPGGRGGAATAEVFPAGTMRADLEKPVLSH